MRRRNGSVKTSALPSALFKAAHMTVASTKRQALNLRYAMRNAV